MCNHIVCELCHRFLTLKDCSELIFCFNYSTGQKFRTLISWIFCDPPVGAGEGGNFSDGRVPKEGQNAHPGAVILYTPSHLNVRNF